MDEFKTLLFKLSAGLISVRTDLIDEEIKEAIKQVGSFLKTGCVLFSELSEFDVV
jgi:hypothetical protein